MPAVIVMDPWRSRPSDVRGGLLPSLLSAFSRPPNESADLASFLWAGNNLGRRLRLMQRIGRICSGDDGSEQSCRLVTAREGRSAHSA